MKWMLLAGCAAVVSCGEFPLPGGGTGEARYHPAGLPCGYPEGLLLSEQRMPGKEGK